MDIALQSRLFAHGVETGLIQEPLDAVWQIASHAGAAVRPVGDSAALPKQAVALEGQDGIAFIAGKTVGKVAEFWLINRAVGAVSGIGNINALSTARSEALKMGISGAASGLLTPVSDKNFGVEKFAGIASEGASFATFGAIAGKAGEFSFLGRPGFRKLWQDAAVNGTAGALSGVVNVDANSLLTTGSLASLDKVGTSMLQNAIMGVGLSALDHSLPRASITIKRDTNGIKGSAQSSEEWSSSVYNTSHGDLRSPILTWLADKNLVPKPAGYAELRQSAWLERNAVDLSLADWSPQQRPAVIQALRRVAHPDLGKDSNIDAFISKLTTSDTITKIAAFKQVETPKAEARDELQRLMAANPAFKDIFPERLLYSPALKPQLDLPENAAVKQSLDRFAILNKSHFTQPANSEGGALDKDLLSKMNGVAKEIGIPNLKAVHAQASDSSSRMGDELYLGLGKVPDLNAVTMDTMYHEFTHHTQGLLSGKETLIYLAKAPYYMAAKRLGLIDDIPMMQSPKNRQEYIHTYVGSEHEKQAWATGFLVRLRAMAAGLPNLSA